MTSDDGRLRACLHHLATRGLHWLTTHGYTRWFAPWRIAGVRPFFRPTWVDSFERKTPGFVYETELMAGSGCILFFRGTGSHLYAQMEKWSRQARGGKMDIHRETGIYRFTPDRNRDDWRHRIIPPAPKRLILPGAPVAAPGLVLLQGGAR